MTSVCLFSSYSLEPPSTAWCFELSRCGKTAVELLVPRSVKWYSTDLLPARKNTADRHQPPQNVQRLPKWAGAETTLRTTWIKHTIFLWFCLGSRKQAAAEMTLRTTWIKHTILLWFCLDDPPAGGGSRQVNLPEKNCCRTRRIESESINLPLRLSRADEMTGWIWSSLP